MNIFRNISWLFSKESKADTSRNHFTTAWYHKNIDRNLLIFIPHLDCIVSSLALGLQHFTNHTLPIFQFIEFFIVLRNICFIKELPCLIWMPSEQGNLMFMVIFLILIFNLMRWLYIIRFMYNLTIDKISFSINNHKEGLTILQNY